MARNTVFVSLVMFFHERETLDRAAKAAGVSRNAFVRRWVRTLDDDDHSEAR